MRSERRGQEQLALDFAAPVAERRRAPAGAVLAAQGASRLRHRVSNDHLVSRGWPAGTVLLVDGARRPRRGELALAVERGRRVVGVYDLELGRPALRHDRGSLWLSPGVDLVGVVVQADAPLPRCPEGPLPGDQEGR